MKKESSISKLFRYAGKFKYLTIISWVLSAASALMALIPFVFIWKIIKEVLNVSPNFSGAKNLTHYGWMAVLFSVLSMAIYIGALLCSHIAAFRVQANIRSKAMHHIVTLPLGFMDGIGSGKIRKIVNESSAATETYLAHQLPDHAGALATPIGLLAMLLVFDYRLGLLSLIPVVVAFGIMSLMTGNRMQEKMKEYQNSLEQMSNEAVEYVRGIPVVKTFGQSVFSFKRFKASIDNYEKWVTSYTKDLRMPMMFFTTAINAVFAVLIGAGLFFTRNEVTNEFLLNLLFYIIITPIITVTLNKIMYSSENMMIVQDALERIDSIMRIKPLSETKAPKYLKDNSVVLKDVSFCYKDAKENALNHISLEINSGEHVAFVGPSGGGKTTLASVIARFWDADSGEVRIGNVNVKDISKEELMNNVSFVFQDSKLLKTSIFENIRLAKPDATREEVSKALKEAQCEDIIEKMTDGIDTVIGTKGNYLSGGEAQRISIARAMLKKAPILILDEATAFADPDNESKVQAAFSTLSKGKTVIMIAHRLSTVTGADCIYVLKGGEICEAGSHLELIKQSGLYAHMWNEYNSAAKWKVGA
ncbi:iron import ATP-binding/permease protein IrtA [Clostridium saccharobutylicum]|uniref:ABC transporter ATP-binding protein n=1 Tax=Clostridium saccharobutylicum TaxID=169679 RepID=UPI000983CD6C|nr:ABC transporter ATP-binding protein [Clostridium saccharobutylicum]AQS09630.1 iron import ATP-binding/permease protein IrtA [Clostridium saccharobutylicum]MBC2436134.1 ABC transporter ATP-binding protein [Clostridium saccharobutylicum]NSB88072.1 ATP-binding cassette subfamily B protein [Clostridium saccharobutylicum]NYC27980.1 ATP-binding cassette subfamily B protein [Clostridium saccharobutylicum]OOM15253.1 iron import ATP-binding/permease protein IrtA [Clostridium saccharobutylicum]